MSPCLSPLFEMLVMSAEPIYPEKTDIRIESANKKADTLLTLASVLEKSPALLSKEELDMLKKEVLSGC